MIDYETLRQDVADRMEAAELNHTFSQGFYLGSQNEKKQHKWYLLMGLIAGGVLGHVVSFWIV